MVAIGMDTAFELEGLEEAAAAGRGWGSVVFPRARFGPSCRSRTPSTEARFLVECLRMFGENKRTMECGDSKDSNTMKGQWLW